MSCETVNGWRAANDCLSRRYVPRLTAAVRRGRWRHWQHYGLPRHNGRCYHQSGLPPGSYCASGWPRAVPLARLKDASPDGCCRALEGRMVDESTAPTALTAAVLVSGAALDVAPAAAPALAATAGVAGVGVGQTKAGAGELVVNGTSQKFLPHSINSVGVLYPGAMTYTNAAEPAATPLPRPAPGALWPPGPPLARPARRPAGRTPLPAPPGPRPRTAR